MHQPPAESNQSAPLFQPSPRRSFLRTAGLLAAAGTGALALPTIARAGPPVGTGLFARRTGSPIPPSAAPLTDESLLNYALNIEYIEAQYYLFALSGTGLSPGDINGSGPVGTVTIKANPRVPFETPALAEFAQDFAEDEVAHVRYLRNLLGNRSVAMPNINLLDSFNTLGKLAGFGDTFDPFADEDSFMLGAFYFEDLGVTAYNGMLQSLSSRDFIQGTGGLLGAEAYHASNIRTVLFSRGITTPAQQISNVRDSFDGTTEKDQGLLDDEGNANISPTDSNGLVFSRTTSQVLNILYLNTGGVPGAFFPNGFNGIIR